MNTRNELFFRAEMPVAPVGLDITIFNSLLLIATWSAAVAYRQPLRETFDDLKPQ